MFYTIYKITNLIDGKIYIGKHQTKDLSDGYMGSGKVVKRAIIKHGIESFKKEIIFQFDNEADMNAKEAELVTEEFCLREDTYNLCPGGKGGWGYVNASGINVYDGVGRTPNVIQNLYAGANRIRTDEDCQYISEYMKKYYSNNPKPSGVYTHSDEIKAKIGLTNSTKQQGKKNSQFGTMWITNGQENKKIQKIDIIPEGWYKGRR